MATIPLKSDSPSCSTPLQKWDFDLPVPEECPPIFPEVTPEEVYAINAQLAQEMVFDDAYFERDRARKVTELFIMH